MRSPCRCVPNCELSPGVFRNFSLTKSSTIGARWRQSVTGGSNGCALGAAHLFSFVKTVLIRTYAHASYSQPFSNSHWCKEHGIDKIDIFIGKIAHTVRMFRHGETLVSPHARRIAQHRDRTCCGNSHFRSTLCSALGLASFPSGRTSVLGPELGTRL